MSETGSQEDDYSVDGEHEMNGYAYFYDTASEELVKKVEVGPHPAHIVFTMDVNFILISNNEGNNVTVLDAKTFQRKGTIPTGKVLTDLEYPLIVNLLM